MKWEDWTPDRFSVLCINHFEEQYIDRTGKYVKLREDAVPTIFATLDDVQKKVCTWSNTQWQWRLCKIPDVFNVWYATAVTVFLM